MSEGISQILAAKALNVLRGFSCTSPYSAKSFRVGLGTALPPATGDFAGIEVPVTGVGYARFNIPTASAASAWLVSGRTVTNTQTALFGPAIVDWVNDVQSVGIFADPTATVAWFFAHLSTGQGCPLGNYIKFSPGELQLSLTTGTTAKSDELVGKQLSLLLGQSYSLPGNDVYIGLGTKGLGQLGNGDIGEFTSVNAPGYQRVQVPATITSFSDPASGRSMTNLIELVYGDATANWALGKSFGVYATPTGGTPWYFAAFPPEQNVLIRKNDNVIIPVSKLQINE